VSSPHTQFGCVVVISVQLDLKVHVVLKECGMELLILLIMAGNICNNYMKTLTALRIRNAVCHKI